MLLQFEVGGGLIPSGVLVSAAGPNGASIYFETGTGLADHSDYAADAKWNSITPYWFDDSQRCLPRGSTDMWVEGHGLNLSSGQLLLIETQPLTTADPLLRQIVQLNATPLEAVDPIFGPTDVTRIFWRSDNALTADRDLTRTVVKGNLVPATEGRRYNESFAIQQVPPATPQMPLAVFRTGANASAVHHYTLGKAPLAWLAPDDPALPPLPEISMVDTPSAAIPHPWTWIRSLLESDAFESAFTVDPVRFAPSATIAQPSPPQSVIMMEYDGDGGDTIRFGDGVFGDIPEDQSVFAITYRAGGGAAGNVPADSITRIEVPTGLLIAVNNPLPATGGADPELAQTVRRLAPQAFRAKQFRAVIQRDYEAAAETLPWVQRAGTIFRWTGSWLTVFTTADPIGSEHIPVGQHVQLIELLNRYRLAGYESYTPDPIYAALDLIIAVCAQGDFFRGDVEAAILRALSTERFVDGSTGFFQFERFTFGQPLERSALEATIQEAQGVAGVLYIQFRRRGITPGFIPMPDTVNVAVNEIILVENDPSRPERGSLQIVVKGSK